MKNVLFAQVLAVLDVFFKSSKFVIVFLKNKLICPIIGGLLHLTVWAVFEKQ